PRAGPLDVEGGGFSGVTRRREGRWWRCSRSAPVEGTPGRSARVVARPSAVAARRAARRRGRRVFRCDSSTRGPLVALQPLGARRGNTGPLGEGGGAAERRSGGLQGWANGNCVYYTHFCVRTVSAPLLGGVLILLEGDYSAWRWPEPRLSVPGRG